ncbi:DUF1254 domain-containing protein [Streptomyces griseofuscus]|uniref:DUF1254 domain-containing protein n=1 Tax=Streptomyces TaxID=1883 RepID=UPI0018F0C90B|nr:DUF1254 domain-containing protein [Streptomyces sp. CRPSP2-6A1]MBJ6998799.1 DUF1254 domain-containing protein [Streptomyces sp. CRPSP2-6A1]
MSEPSQSQSQSPAWRRIPEDVAGAAVTVARAAGHAALHPRATIDRARHLPEIVPALGHAVKPILTGRMDDWRGEYAYTLGEQAFVYGFPYIYNARLRHDWVTRPRNPATIPYAPVNHFWHAERLLDATYRDGGCPNNDTLYSTAWVYLGDEPVILSHPDMGERYFTFELVGITSDNFDYVGQRTTGSDTGGFALVGPGWKGKLPAGVRHLKKAPSPWVLILGRTLVDGPDDVPRVRALQEQYRLTPLSLFGKKDAEVPESRDVLVPVPAEEDPLGPWKTLNLMLAENPPPSRHRVLLQQFAQIGIGPGLDVEAQPEAVRRSLARAAAVGVPLLKQQILSGDWAELVHGWRYPPPEMGRFGDDFLKRAADQSLIGVAANDPAEAVYLLNFEDANGDKLESGGRYELRFPGDALPPVDAFWSLTAYGEDMNLIPNPADRYSVGDRSAGLRRDADGGLTLHLQRERPEEDKEANWLPTTADGTWFVALRMYRPSPAVIDATWECPPLTRVA